MKIKFITGKRNRYKFPIGIYINKLPCYPLVEGKVQKYAKGMRTITFRVNHNIYGIFINWNKIKHE